MHGSTPHTALTSEESYISNIFQFKWYDWCYYRENKEKFPFNKELLGRILGPANGEGNEMAQWALKPNGRVVPRRIARPLNGAELCSEVKIRKHTFFDALIEGKLGTSMISPKEEIPEFK